MAALTASRDPKLRAGGAKPEHIPVPVGLAANVKLFAGGLTAIDATGRARPARSIAANSDVVVAVSEREVSNVGGAAGAVATEGLRRGVVELNNDNGDPVTIAAIGRSVYAVDDQTVAASSGGGTRVAAGKFWGFDEDTGRPLVEVG